MTTTDNTTHDEIVKRVFSLEKRVLDIEMREDPAMLLARCVGQLAYAAKNDGRLHMDPLKALLNDVYRAYPHLRQLED